MCNKHVVETIGSDDYYFTFLVQFFFLTDFSSSLASFLSVDFPRIQLRMVFGTIWKTQGVQVAGLWKNWKSLEIQHESSLNHQKVITQFAVLEGLGITFAANANRQIWMPVSQKRIEIRVIYLIKSFVNMGYNIWHFSPITMAEMVCKVAQHRLYILNWPINEIENPKTMSSLKSVLYFVCLFVCFLFILPLLISPCPHFWSEFMASRDRLWRDYLKSLFLRGI